MTPPEERITEARADAWAIRRQGWLGGAYPRSRRRRVWDWLRGDRGPHFEPLPCGGACYRYGDKEAHYAPSCRRKESRR